MALATNPRDNIQRVEVTAGGYVQLACERACRLVEISQLGSETAAPLTVKHSSDDPDELHEYVAAGGVWAKGGVFDLIRPYNVFQPGDTYGFFQRVGVGTSTLVIREYEV